MFGLISRHKAVFSFCLIMTFFTGLGQTYFITQFSESMLEANEGLRPYFDITYSMATLLASFMLSHMGRKIDELGPIRPTLVTILMVSLALLTLSYASGPFTLFAGFLMMRGFGQVSLGLSASTVVSKSFGRHRGKALSVLSLGRTLAEAVLPIVSVTLIHRGGYAYSLRCLALGLILVGLPTVIILGKYLPNDALYEESESVKKVKREKRNWSWKNLLGDYRPLALMIAGMILPFVITGLFFHQSKIIALKDWTLIQMGQGFIVFSIVHTIGNFSVGPIIDRFGSRQILPWVLFPLLLATSILLLYSGSMGLYLYMGLMGLSTAFSGMTRNSIWAEVYDATDLGRIKGMDSNFLVIGTSLAPFLYSQLFNWTHSAMSLVWLSIGVITMGIVLFSIVSMSYSQKNA